MDALEFNALDGMRSDVEPSLEMTLAPRDASTSRPLVCGFRLSPCAGTLANVGGLLEPKSPKAKTGRVAVMRT